MRYIKICLLLAAVLALGGCGQNETATVSASKEKTLTLTFAGDCTLGSDTSFGGITLPRELELQGGDFGYFLKNVQPYFATDDLTVVNLEGTLTDRGVRAEKTYAFRGDPSYVQILSQGSVEAVTLANNHSRDYGEISFTDTQAHLEKAGISWVEGTNVQVLDVKGVKIGLIGLNGLSSAAQSQLPMAMEKVKNQGAKWIVVQMHWGIEKENYPTAQQRTLAHSAIDLGADAVIGHHPHVLQGVEEYQGKLIVYSLGNFCFGGNQNPADKDCMMVQQTLTVKEDGALSCKSTLIPCSISSVAERNNYQPTPRTGLAGARIAERITRFSEGLSPMPWQFVEIAL